jgi:hypothetical protein
MCTNLRGIRSRKPKRFAMTPIYLNQEELAARFRVSPRTLERWRWLKTGPNYVKLGGKVVYALEDVEAYERRRRAETHSSILGSWR